MGYALDSTDRYMLWSSGNAFTPPPRRRAETDHLGRGGILPDNPWPYAGVCPRHTRHALSGAHSGLLELALRSLSPEKALHLVVGGVKCIAHTVVHFAAKTAVSEGDLPWLDCHHELPNPSASITFAGSAQFAVALLFVPRMGLRLLVENARGHWSMPWFPQLRSCLRGPNLPKP